MVAFGSADGTIQSAGIATSQNFVNMFATAENSEGKTIAQAYLSAYVTKDPDSGLLESGVKIRADKIDFQSGTLKISADNINFVGKTVINDKFVVDSNGNVTLNGLTAEGKITGSIRNPFYPTNISPAFYNKDNIALVNSTSSSTTFATGNYEFNCGSNPAEQCGRLIRFVAGRWGTNSSEGTATVSIRDSSYNYYKIWENGIERDSIEISNEVVELIAFGSTTQLFGYIVLNRIDFMSRNQYGKPFKVLAMGRMLYSYESNAHKVNLTYESFDGTTIEASRVGTGEYKLEITHPVNKRWFENISHALVFATGLGKVYDATTPCKANVSKIEIETTTYNITSSGTTITVVTKTLDRDGVSTTTNTSTNSVTGNTVIVYVKTRIYIDTSDDDSRNEGGFQFMITNMNDFHNR